MSSKNSDFSRYLSEFLTVYLPYQRGYSKNTIYSYRDTFKRLLLFFENKNVHPHKIGMDDINKDNVIDFLNWLSSENKVSASTLNNRLAAIKSFLHYVVFASPENLYNFQQVFEISFKKKPGKIIPSLSLSQIKNIFNAVETNSKQGLRELAILSVLYDSGARVQELADLRVQDFCAGTNPYLLLRGKGNKSRKVPITQEVSKLIQKYKQTFRLDEQSKGMSPLFVNNRGEKLTRSGITYILNKYVQIAREKDQSIPVHVHCHMMRHSKAFHLLEAGVALPYIQDFLGHADVTTTQVYARASLEMKAKAINKAYPTLVEDRPEDWTEKPELMEFLESL